MYRSYLAASLANQKRRREKPMALFVALGGLVGGAVVLATLRSKRNAKKPDHLTTMKIR
jgi:sensor c-di-GMP phosphodiesterase-like protein